MRVKMMHYTELTCNRCRDSAAENKRINKTSCVSVSHSASSTQPQLLSLTQVQRCTGL